MIKFYLLGLFLFVFAGISAQVNVSISGRIYDAETSEELPFATVALYQDSLFISGTISGDDGRFILSGNFKGDYTVKISFIGYLPTRIPILIGELNTNFNLGKISLASSATELNEVTVKAQKSLVSSEMDKKVFDMKDNVARSGRSALDALKTLPGITFSQEGKIFLRGSDKVAVLIDGKQSSLTGFGNQKSLDNISAANIESIEIIHNPSAKYDASGMAGIINLIYKKQTKIGLNGDIGVSQGMGAFSKVKADLPTRLGSFSMNPKYAPSVNLNLKKSNLNFFLRSELMLLEKLPNNEFTTRNYDNGKTTISQVPENREQTHVVINAGLDWELDPNNLFTFSVAYDWESHVDTAQVAYFRYDTSLNPTSKTDFYRYYHWNEEEKTGFMNYAVSYLHKFAEPGHELNTNLQYTKGWEDESYFLNDSSATRIGKDATHILAKEHTTSLSSDYTKPLKNGKLETGIKLRWRRLPVEYTITPGTNSIIYPGMGDWSDWGEDIYAAYVNYLVEKSWLTIEAGLRAEYSKVFYEIAPENIYYSESDSYDNFEFFPNARLTFKPNDKNGISLFYNHRVDRPEEPELRIFPKYDDPELLKVGNPYLRPQYTQSFELAYNYKWQSGSTYIAAYHRSIKDAFRRIYSIDESSEYSIVNKIYQNTGNASNQGIELLLEQKLNSFWKFSGSVNWYVNTLDAYTGTILFPYQREFHLEKSKDNSWDMKLNNQFDFRNGVQIQLSGIYYAPKNIPQGKQLARSSIDFGIKDNIMDDRGEISFSISDIFNKFGIRQEINGDGFTALYENYYETQIYSIGLKYFF